MSISLKRDYLTFLNLPRVGNPLGSQGKNDFEQVGFGSHRTARDHGLTALNNAIAVGEDIIKAVAAPVVGTVLGVYAAASGNEVAIGPGAPKTGIGFLARSMYAVGGPVVGAVGTIAYGTQACADLGQAAIAAVRAGVALAAGNTGR